ncbi:unnamed protein product [Heligmosomoides polygyrus]|uniref:ORC4_C domain-containing protein n=1 Tax=Heligmosomoides polygyrus TaxID=6339 RepID=A0A183FS53_HELPZ|nr:unnamed protein product [Heligmosomoides polygyrus]
MRSSSLQRLRAVLSQWSPISHIHCYGVAEADVLVEIKHALESLQKNDKFSLYVVVNCFLVNGSLKQLIEEILRELDLYRDGKVNTVNGLAVFLSEHLFAADQRRKLTIVLDQAQCLSSFPATTVKSLLSLPKSMAIICPELDEPPLLRFVTHCELPWDRIGMLNMVPQPVSVAFESRSEDECIDVIMEALSEHDISRKVVEYVVKAVFFECRDSERMLQIVLIACEKYSEKHGNVSDIKNMKLLPVQDALFHGKEKRSEARERRADQIAEQRDPESKAADLQRIKCIYLSLVSLYPVKDIDMNVDINPQVNIVSIVDRSVVEAMFKRGSSVSTVSKMLKLHRMQVHHVIKRFEIATLCSWGSMARTTSAANLDQPKFRCMESFENVNEIAQ